jgi:hypothetical protein
MIWYDIWYDMIYLLNAYGEPLGGSSTVHIYTQIIPKKTKIKQYIEEHKNFERVWRDLKLKKNWNKVIQDEDDRNILRNKS